MQIDNEGEIFDWLSREPDPDERLRFLDWFAGFAVEPTANAIRVPALSAPIYLVVVPLRKPVTVKFLLALQFNSVKIISIDPLI